jgi:hypothetical protein
VPPDERLGSEPRQVEAEAHGQRTVLDDEATAARLIRAALEEGVPGGLPRGRAPVAMGGVDLTDYSRNPQARGFGPACQVQLAKVSLTEASFSTNLFLAELAWLIMAANEKQGYLYRRADTGSYNCRKIAGTDEDSWHSWADAIDSNWLTNPYQSPLHTDRPQWERDRWNRFGFAGGWDYTGAKDAMHSEYMGRLDQVGALLVIARQELLPIINGTPPAPAVVVIREEDKDMSLIRNANGTVVWITPTWAEWVPTSADLRALRRQQGNEETLSDDMFNRAVARARAAGGGPAAASGARTVVDGEELGDDPSTWPPTPEDDG